MPHLNLEALARIVDEAPHAEEAEHLAGCAACRTELDALREDVHALGMLPDMTPAPDGWAALERRLGDEGLIRTRRPAPSRVRLTQAAAAVVLFLAGSLAGRMTAAPAPATIAQADPVAAPAADAGDPLDSAPAVPDDDEAAASDDATRLAAADRPRPTPPSSTRLASSGFTGGQPRTMEEAAELLRETEALYLTALTRYAEYATQSEAGDPIARLAALQSIVMTTQAALSQAPADPVINGVHLATLAQRDATLAQVAAATGERWYE